MRRVAVALVVVLSLGVTGCGRKDNSALIQVRDAMAATARLPRGVVYTERVDGKVIEVRSRIHDDLRYKTSVALDGARVLDEVVVDDALADRIVDVRAFPLLGAPPVDTLLGGQWFVDKLGAPSLLPSDTSRLRTGTDVVIDALTVFRYVDRVMGESAGVHRFDPDSLSYRPREDPFPHPDRGSGEIRYDADRPSLPRPNTAAASGRVVPGPQHFRKLAVYVRGGRVTRVLEQIDVGSRLRDLERIFNLGLAGVASNAERATRAALVLNQARRITGGEPIRVRTLDVRIVDIGLPVDVELPDGAVDTNLSALPRRGQREAARP